MKVVGWTDNTYRGASQKLIRGGVVLLRLKSGNDGSFSFF